LDNPGSILSSSCYFLSSIVLIVVTKLYPPPREPLGTD
jgi:hypothetical protein